MKKTSVLMAIIAMTLSVMPMAIAAGHAAEITSPSAGEVIYQNTLYLEATSGADVSVNVAVRTTTVGDTNCSIAGNVVLYRDVTGDLSTDEYGVYAEEIDITGAAPGLYCFAFDPFDAPRISQKFYIVDDYAKVGGVVDTGGDSKGNGTHSMEGVVGDAGTAGIVGSIVINFRALGETCTFTPGFGTFDILQSVVGGANYAALLGWDNDCAGDYPQVYVLDRGASELFPRGGFMIPKVIGDFGQWIPMLKGNNHVGTR